MNIPKKEMPELSGCTPAEMIAQAELAEKNHDWIAAFRLYRTAEELDAFQVGEDSFNKLYNEDIEKYPWSDLFTRHHLQDFFHPEFNVSGDVEVWELDPSADVWEITCDSRARYAFFFALFTAIAQESGTTLRFYCDGMKFEITPGVPMPAAEHSEKECRAESSEPAKELPPEEYDEEDIPF